MASSLIKPARLGSIDLAVPLGIGTMFWGDSFIDSRFGPILPAGDLRGVVDMALSARVTLFDTAEGYGGGSSEQRLAEALSGAAPSSSSPVIMTKFLPTIWRWTEYSFFSALRACQRRLGGRPIGVFFIHTPVHPRFEFWVRCACKARQQGLIQEVGLSNCSAEQVELAVRVASSLNQRIAANQVGPMHSSTRQVVTHLPDSVGALTVWKLWVSHSQSPDQPRHIASILLIPLTERPSRPHRRVRSSSRCCRTTPSRFGAWSGCASNTASRSSPTRCSVRACSPTT